MQEEDAVADRCSAPGTSCVHGSMEVLKSVLLLLLASLKERGHTGHGPYLKACGWSDGTAIMGLPITVFRPLAYTLPRLLSLAKVTRKTTRARDPEADPGLLR